MRHLVNHHGYFGLQGIDLTYTPFDDALDEFLRHGPVGVVPETIRANDIDWQAFRRLSRDEMYEGSPGRASGRPSDLRARPRSGLDVV